MSQFKTNYPSKIEYVIKFSKGFNLEDWYNNRGKATLFEKYKRHSIYVSHKGVHVYKSRFKTHTYIHKLFGDFAVDTLKK